MLGLYDPDTIMAAASSGTEQDHLDCAISESTSEPTGSVCSPLIVGVPGTAHGSQAKNSRQSSAEEDCETVPREDGGAAGGCQEGVVVWVPRLRRGI